MRKSRPGAAPRPAAMLADEILFWKSAEPAEGGSGPERVIVAQEAFETGNTVIEGARIGGGPENFAGCAVIISHDRFFPDRPVTHILAFEGDSHVEWFEAIRSL